MHIRHAHTDLGSGHLRPRSNAELLTEVPFLLRELFQNDGCIALRLCQVDLYRLSKAVRIRIDPLDLIDRKVSNALRIRLLREDAVGTSLDLYLISAAVDLILQGHLGLIIPGHPLLDLSVGAPSRKHGFRIEAAPGTGVYISAPSDEFNE